MVDLRVHFVPVCALLICVGCTTNATPLVLDLICRNQFYNYAGSSGGEACRVSGDAKATTGITGDTYAVHLGSSTGALHIKLAAIANTTQSSWSLDVLAAATAPEGSPIYRSVTWGTCAGQCTDDPADVQAALKSEFQWAKVVEGLAGTAGPYPPDDAELTLRGADIDIVDLRLPGFDSYDQYYYY